MSLFVDFRIGIPNQDAQVLCSSWCKVDSLLAVGTNDSCIRFYQEEGELLEKATYERNKEVNVCAMDWRIRSKVLASGWEDGTVSIWNVKDRIAKEDSAVHSNPITFMKWSPEGTRLISADSAGLVCVWKTDHRSRLTLVSKYKVQADQRHGGPDGITTCTWAITPEYRRSQKDLPTPPQSFFIATENGLVVSMGLNGQMTAITTVSENHASVSSMLWYEEEQRLVVITKDCVMSQYRVQPGAPSLVQISSVKLSMNSSAAKEGTTDAIWAGRPGLLTTCAKKENMVRFWDLKNDDSYALSLGTASNRSSDSVTGIAYNPRKRMLAAGTQAGSVHIWKFVGDFQNQRNSSDETMLPFSSSSPAVDWEDVAKFPCSEEAVESVNWAHTGGFGLAVTTERNCSIHTETELHRSLRNDVAAMQVSAQRILVHRGASIRIDLKVGMRIKGIAVNDSHMIVWDRKRVEVYEFRNDSMELTSTFPSTAGSIAIHGQTIFQAIGSKLEVCNLQGVVRKSISFTEQEGQPKFLDINNKFMAVSTSAGKLKVYDVSRAEPKPLGGGTTFELGAIKKSALYNEKMRSIPGSSKSKSRNNGNFSLEIRSIKCNANGTKISILSDIVSGSFLCEPNTCIHVWNADKGEFQPYEFGPHRYPVSHFWDGQEPKLLSCEAKRRMRTERPASPVKKKRFNISDENRDINEEKETTDSVSEKQKQITARRPSAALQHEVEVVTLFATEENMGVMIQDSFPLEKSLDALLGLKVPRLFFISKPVATQQGVLDLPRLKGKTMRDFVGLDTKLEEDMKKALIDFSYYLCIGNMDEAYRAVRLIQNVTVWENMAHMCVKTRRLDVAEVCLGNMGHARGSCALREAKLTAPERDARIAMVAIQLGLLEEAESLYMESGRFDLLNKLLQARGHWEKALEVANEYDRVHLRTTHFAYAKFLESVGDTDAAVKNYEAAGVQAEQVPRMYFDLDRLDELERYVLQSSVFMNEDSDSDDDSSDGIFKVEGENESESLKSMKKYNLVRWWGQYCESIGELDRAIHVYQRAGDEMSLVRVYCYNENMQAAADVALNSPNPQASFLLAKKCEQRGDVKEAIQFYSRAGRYNHAVRLAKTHELHSEMVNLALRSSKSTMVDAAKYLEAKGLYDKAVTLYQQGGNIPRALDLCFRAQLFDLLSSITDSLNSRTGDSDADGTTESSPEVLNRCADFFMSHGQYEKAVNLYVTATDYETALEICMKHKVTITEEMAERMTLAKLSASSNSKEKEKISSNKARQHNERRQELLEKIAKCCERQRSFHLATRKYTQAGDKISAMKCLRESGDTKKIMFFAKQSRSPEVYILAANYLQSLDWRTDEEILKAIIFYYTKARSFEKLSQFYHACAQDEIVTYKDYEKALSALKEAIKYINKANSNLAKQNKTKGANTRIFDVEDRANSNLEILSALQNRISVVERFVHAKKLMKKDPAEGERVFTALLTEMNDSDREEFIPSGDIYAALVEYQYQKRDMDQAYQLLEQMRSRNIILGPYLDKEMLESICRAVGVEMFQENDLLGQKSDFRYEQDDGRSDHEISDGEIDESIEEASWEHK